MERVIENNKVMLGGEIVSNFEFNHEVYGEKFCTAQLASERLSGQRDIIPITVSERIVDVNADWIGQYVRISGQFRSYNKHEANGSKLILSVFVREIELMYLDDIMAYSPNINEIFLDGYICKPTVYRKTPLGREIADILLAVNRPYGKSDYIPCIAWGRNARFIGTLETGARLRINGRIQNREYLKKLDDDERETRIAYEVSASRVEFVEKEAE